MSERLLAAIKRGKREGYVIAELPGVVRVIQDPESTGPRVDLCWDENNRTAGTDLADIIVRGIRSLEEEKRRRAGGVYDEFYVDYAGIELDRNELLRIREADDEDDPPLDCRALGDNELIRSRGTIWT